MTVDLNGLYMIENRDFILNIFKNNYGYSTLKNLVDNNIHTSIIKFLLDDGIIEKIKPGLYKLSEYNLDNISTYIDICRANQFAVICNITALSYYELTTQISYEIDVAIPNDRKPNKIIFPQIKYHYFRESTYKIGIDEIKTESGSFKIYNKEKSICDIFRNKRLYGEDVIIEAMKEYLNLAEKDINKLYEYSKICRVEKQVYQYIKILNG